MPPKREIIYPVFLECCQYADDTFWEGIFEELAYGKAPYGTYISKNFLCCSYKNKEFSYKIERKDPKELYDDIYKILTEKLGILSRKEKAQKKVLFTELEKNIKQSRKEWSSIRRKNVKDTLYEKYVIDMKKKYALSAKQSKYLLAIILISIMFKTITAKDITYSDDRIQNISGLEFSTDSRGKGKVLFKRLLCSDIYGPKLPGETRGECDSISEAQSELEQWDNQVTLGKAEKFMSENWEKYLKLLKEKL